LDRAIISLDYITQLYPTSHINTTAKLSCSLADPLCQSLLRKRRLTPVTPLLLARSLTVSFFNPFRRAQAENASGQITVQVKWGRDR